MSNSRNLQDWNNDVRHGVYSVNIQDSVGRRFLYWRFAIFWGQMIQTSTILGVKAMLLGIFKNFKKPHFVGGKTRSEHPLNEVGRHGMHSI